MNKKPSIILIGIIILAAAIISIIGIADAGNLLSDKTIKTNQKNTESPIQIIQSKSFKYSSVCDFGEYEEFFKLVYSKETEIWGGKYNDHEAVVSFFKENKILAGLGMSPDDVFGPESNSSYDPLFYDGMFWMPVALEIMGASPELIKILEVEEGENENSYSTRLAEEKTKCK